MLVRIAIAYYSKLLYNVTSSDQRKSVIISELSL